MICFLRVLRASVVNMIWVLSCSGAAFGAAGWSAPDLLSIPGSPRGIAVGNVFPSVPYDSIVATSFNGGNAKVWTWDPAASQFSAATLTAGNQPMGVAIGDVCPPTGVPKIVVANSADSTLSLFVANLSPTPSPVFFSIFSPLPVGSNAGPVAVAVADGTNDLDGTGPYRTIAIAANNAGALFLARYDGSAWNVSEVCFTSSWPVAVAFGMFQTTPGATPSPVVAVADACSKSVRLIGLDSSLTPVAIGTICLPTPPAGSPSPISMGLAFATLGSGTDQTLAVTDPGNDEVVLYGAMNATPTIIPAPPITAGGQPIGIAFRNIPACTCSPTAWARQLYVAESAGQTLRLLCNEAGGISAPIASAPNAVAAGNLFGTAFDSAALPLPGYNAVAVYYPPGAKPASVTITGTWTATPTATVTHTITPTWVFGFTPSLSGTITDTFVPISTATETETPLAGFTGSETLTRTHSRTAFTTSTSTSTVTSSPTADTPSLTATATKTATVTPATWAANRNYIVPRDYKTLILYLPDEHGETTAAVYTPSGQQVRYLGRSTENTVVWDGLNDQGEVVAVGIYLVYAKTMIGARTFKIAVVN